MFPTPKRSYASAPALVAQWIEHAPPKRGMQVRLLPGASPRRIFAASSRLTRRGQPGRRRRSRCTPAPASRPPAAAPRRRRRLDPRRRRPARAVATRARSRRSTASARASSGAPESPPLAGGAPCWPGRRARSVVFVAMMPSSPSSSARSATASMSASARSGAIFTSSGRAARARRAPPHGGDERAQRLDRLQVAQAGRVRRADVDRQVIGKGASRSCVVGGRLLGRRAWSCRC